MSVLIVGATRGLGAALTTLYASDHSTAVYATSRSQSIPSEPSGKNINWITSIDLASPEVGSALSSKLKDVELSIVIITAGYFATESFDSPSWENEIKMYTTSAIAPVFLVSSLASTSSLKSGAKIIIVTSESGSITLRHEKEGGGNYGHHASKAASNMVVKLLSLDLKERGVGVVAVHPGFMRTEMTRGVGFDKFWDDGGAVTPDVAAKSLVSFVDKFDMSMTGQYWAPRGPGDIGTAPEVLGKDLPTPLQLPW